MLAEEPLEAERLVATSPRAWTRTSGKKLGGLRARAGEVADL